MPTLTYPSRRTILAALSSLGVGALAQRDATAADSSDNPRRIDAHHHYVSPKWMAALEKYHTQYAFSGIEQFRQWSPTAAIEAMDRAGVARAVLTTTTPGIWFGDDAQARDLARDMNEYGAKLVSDHKGRFTLFAVLPLPDVEASLKEMDYALGALGAQGISVLSSYDTKWLGDASFAPVWDELNRRKAVVFSHATAPSCCRGLVPGIQDVTVEFNTDTSRTIVDLIESGTAARVPDLQFIFSHAGGTIPSLAGRYLASAAQPEALNAPAAPNSKLGQLRRFYYDTAGSANPVQMTSLKMIVPVSQILYGTDFPWGNPARIATQLGTCGFSEAELSAIYRENALRLLPRLKV